MKSFWLFRSNIVDLEYYHKYKTLEEFVKNCHDYYMLLLIWLLEKGYMDSVVVWRLTDKPRPDINFTVNGRLYLQKWVKNFNEVFNYPSPKYSLFRGGFKEYDKITIQNSNHLGTKLYLGTGKRIYPQYGGNYDIFLQEDMKDFDPNRKCLPFYKTASPEIFHPIENKKLEYDICWPANFTQNSYKGQKFFMNVVGHCPKLKGLKIVHCGNKPDIGRRMARNYNISNIKFVGHVDRPTLNEYLNKSKFGLCVSNRTDGCPRVLTEILMSGTPLLIRKTTRLLPYFRQKGVMGFNDNNIIPNIINKAIPNWSKMKTALLTTIKSDLSFNRICQKNIDEWKKI